MIFGAATFPSAKKGPYNVIVEDKTDHMEIRRIERVLVILKVILTTEGYSKCHYGEDSKGSLNQEWLQRV